MKPVFKHMRCDNLMDYIPPPVEGKTDNLRIGAVLLARSNFGRWPDKLLADIAGKPMIERMIERVKKIKGFDVVILSTTNRLEDRWLKLLAEQYNIECITGPADDRGLRFKEAVREYDLDYFSDVPTNQPFFDIEATTELIQGIRDCPGHECYVYAHVSGGGVIGHVSNKCITDRYTDETDQEMWHQEIKYQTFMYDGNEVDLRNKYLIHVSVAYPMDIAIINKIIEHLGYYPEKYDDIIKAYWEIKTL